MASPAVILHRRPSAERVRAATASPGPLPRFRLHWLFSSRGDRPREDHLRHRVLLIEDDADIAQMYRLAMRHAGLDLAVASDGASGLEHLRNHRYQLVLLDLGLPGHHGFEILDEIRSDPALGRPKVVIVSNYSEESTVREGLKRGAADYVVKSNVTPRELTQLVARWLLG